MDNEVKVTVTSEDKTDTGFKSAEIRGKSFGERMKAMLTKTGKEGAQALTAPLQAQIGQWNIRVKESEGVVESLRRKIAETGDTKLFGDLSKAEADLRKLSKFRDSLVGEASKAGKESAEGFSLNFAGRVGPLMAKAPIGGPLLAAVAAAGPAISATLTTAITTGATLGAVGLGVAISSQNPQVKASAASLKTIVSTGLVESAAPFVPAVLSSIEKVKAGFRTIRPELDAIFAKSSTYLDPLTEGGIGFVTKALPGFRKVVDAAEDLVDILGEELPELGGDFASTLESMAESAKRNEDEFRAILDTVGLIVVGLGSAVTLMDYLAAGPTRTFLDLLRKGSDEGTNGILFVQGAVDDTAESFATAADTVRSFREEMQKLIDSTLDVESANLAWQAAIDATTASAKENGKTLDDNTEKGRANRGALLEQARAGLEYADAIYEEKAALGDVAGAEQAAEAAYRESRRALVQSARQFGMTAAEAEAYVSTILGIPPTRNTRADFTGDNAGVRNWKKTLSGIPREIFTSARLRAIVNVEVRREQATTATGRAHGGIVGSAQSGGTRAGVTVVGEYGREIVDLPPGANVRSNPDTERLLAGGGGGMGNGPIVLDVRPRPGADTPLMNKIVEGLIFTIQTQGESNPQAFLSGGKAR